MLKHLLPLIPEHVCYCEPFAGGLAMLFAKERSRCEVVNDLNGDLVALYRNVRFHLPEVERELEWFLGSRKDLKDYRIEAGLTEIQRVTRFLLRNRISFGGGGTSFGVIRTAGGGAQIWRDRVRDLMLAAHRRLDGVLIEHLPYERCLELYDSKDTFFFIDPHYLHADVHCYDGWTEDQLREFRRRLRSLKGRWMVTLDDSEFNRKLFKGCHMVPISTKNGIVNNRTHGKQKFGELIITPSK